MFRISYFGIRICTGKIIILPSYVDKLVDMWIKSHQTHVSVKSSLYYIDKVSISFEAKI